MLNRKNFQLIVAMGGICWSGWTTVDLALLLLPLLDGELLHIDDGIALIDNLEAEHGLDDILHGDETSETSVFVDDG